MPVKFVSALLFALLFSASVASPVAADRVSIFRFESIRTIEDMQAFLRMQFPPGTPRNALRQVFMKQAGATGLVHPVSQSSEKYLYDINLCRYYIWRWNISGDFDMDDNLKQLYLNGQALYEGADPLLSAANTTGGQNQKIVQIKRPRPEADKGETAPAAMVYDHDGNLETVLDQKLLGTGPSQVDPANMGKMITYTDVSPWRSIFDMDDAKEIVPYAGDCAAADAKYGGPATAAAP